MLNEPFVDLTYSFLLFKNTLVLTLELREEEEEEDATAGWKAGTAPTADAALAHIAIAALGVNLDSILGGKGLN